MTINLSNLLASQIASQVTGYLPYDSTYNTDSLKKINFVTAANGLFRVEKTDTAVFKTKVQDFEQSVPGLQEMGEGTELLIPKIPFKYLQMALSFYRDVHAKDGTEASLLFFWNKENKALPVKYSDDTPMKGLLVDGQLVIYVPRQQNSSGLSEFHGDPMVDWLRQNLSYLAETHSHHTMDAFFSSTDDANENSTQFYGVWGRIKNEQPAFAFRYVTGKSKKLVCPSVLFDWPMIVTTSTHVVSSTVPGFESETYTETTQELYRGPFENIEYPAEWMEQHTKKYVAPVVKSTFPSNSYLAKANGKLQPLSGQTTLFPEDFEGDLYGLEEAMYGSHLLNEGYGGHTSLPFSTNDFERAEIVQFLDLKDEANKLDIADNVADITADYAKLGYNQVIEAAIGAVKQNQI